MDRPRTGDEEENNHTGSKGRDGKKEQESEKGYGKKALEKSAKNYSEKALSIPHIPDTKRLQGIATAYGTNSSINTPKGKDDVGRRQTRQPAHRKELAGNIADDREVSGLEAVIEESCIADFTETFGQYMEKEATDKFNPRECEDFGGAISIVFHGKRNAFIGNRKNAVIGNGNPMRVAAKIFDGIAELFEGFLDERDPVLAPEELNEYLPLFW